MTPAGLQGALLGQPPPEPAGHRPSIANTFALKGLATNDLSAADRPGRAADTLRTLALRRRDDAWANFSEELKTQRLIWESLRMVKGKSKAYRAALEALEEGFEQSLARKATEPELAVEILMKTLEECEDDTMLSNSIHEAAHEVRRQEAALPVRLSLAEKLEDAEGRKEPAAEAQAVPRQARTELEALFAACELHDATLERHFRRQLGLPQAKMGLGPTAQAHCKSGRSACKETFTVAFVPPTRTAFKTPERSPSAEKRAASKQARRDALMAVGPPVTGASNSSPLGYPMLGKASDRPSTPEKVRGRITRSSTGPIESTQTCEKTATVKSTMSSRKVEGQISTVSTGTIGRKMLAKQRPRRWIV